MDYNSLNSYYQKQRFNNDFINAPATGLNTIQPSLLGNSKQLSWGQQQVSQRLNRSKFGGATSRPPITPSGRNNQNQHSQAQHSAHSAQAHSQAQQAQQQQQQQHAHHAHHQHHQHNHNRNHNHNVQQDNRFKISAKEDFKNDYSNNYIHSDKLPIKYIRNVENTIEGYPKLQRLFKLKEQQIGQYATKPYGCRVEPNKMVETLNNWIYRDKLVFDVIMIGALTENQFIYPLLTQLPIDKLCSKPGFLFIWASTQKITELTNLLIKNKDWNKKFRRSEELIFVPIDKDSPYYPYSESDSDENFLENLQWHCWMCITGTVRRSIDNHLIHCNINTDLNIENDKTINNAVPQHLYQVAENFSSSTRRLHIVPSRVGLNTPIRLRSGWVILSPDVLLDNFDPNSYKQELYRVGSNVPIDNEIEQLRPKSPVQKK